MEYVFTNSVFKKYDSYWIEKNANNDEFSYILQKECKTYYEIFDKDRDVLLHIFKDASKCLASIKGESLYTLYADGKVQYISKVQPTIYYGKSNIAVVMLYTPNFSHVSKYAEANIVSYCERHSYTLYVYHESIISPNSNPHWNKPIVLKNHINKHEYIMWIDADAIVTNFDIKLETIIENAKEYDLLVCNDIGGWTFNSGVLIWKNTEWSRKILDEWWDMEHVPHMKGGDQVQLINLLRKHNKKYKIHDQVEFNCHPAVHKEGMFILHMMGKSGDERIKQFKYWNRRLGIL